MEVSTDIPVAVIGQEAVFIQHYASIIATP
jgi:hypothetical protein